MKLNRKNKLLLLGFLVSLYICYSFAISSTIIYYKDYHSKNEMIIDNNNEPKLINQLYQKEKQLDVLLSNYNLNTLDFFQSELLKQLTIYSEAYHLKINDFREPHVINEKDLVVSSYIFSLEGSFNGCLVLLNKIENNPTLGSIKHVTFTKKKNYKTNLEQLFVEVIMQKSKGG